MQLAEIVLGQEADQGAVLPADHPAQQHQLYALVVGELLVDHQVAGDHGEAAAVQLAGQPEGGGADVEEYRLAVPDHRRGARRYGVLLRHAHLGDLGEGLVALVDDGTAVHTREQSVVLQLDQVAPDRGGAHTQLLGEVGHSRGTAGAQGPQDELMSSFCQHDVNTTRHHQSFPCSLLLGY